VTRRRTARWRARGGALVAPDPREMLALAAPRDARARLWTAAAISLAVHAALGTGLLLRQAAEPAVVEAIVPIALIAEPAPAAPGTPALAASPPPALARAVPPAPPKPAAAEKAAAAARRGPTPSKVAAPTAPLPPVAAAPAAQGSEAAPGAGAAVAALAPAAAQAGAGPGGDSRGAYLSSVTRRIEAQKRYPALARSRGVEGTVLITLWIAADGVLERLEVGAGAPPLLAGATREAVERASPFPPPPHGLSSIRIPVRYALR
jgi:protein TonB